MANPHVKVGAEKGQMAPLAANQGGCEAIRAGLPHLRDHRPRPSHCSREELERDPDCGLATAPYPIAWLVAVHSSRPVLRRWPHAANATIRAGHRLQAARVPASPPAEVRGSRTASRLDCPIPYWVRVVGRHSSLRRFVVGGSPKAHPCEVGHQTHHIVASVPGPVATRKENDLRRRGRPARRWDPGWANPHEALPSLPDLWRACPSVGRAAVPSLPAMADYTPATGQVPGPVLASQAFPRRSDRLAPED